MKFNLINVLSISLLILTIFLLILVLKDNDETEIIIRDVNTPFVVCENPEFREGYWYCDIDEVEVVNYGNKSNVIN